MPSQRPFFLSTFFAAFRQQPPSALPTASAGPQPNKHTAQPGASTTTSYGSPTAPRAISSTAAAAAAAATSPAAPGTASARTGVIGQLPLHSPRQHGAIPIPQPSGSGRRRGSDSSSEGFRDVLGADKLYIGGRTAAGEEKFFKLGVVRRVRSGDRLSIDRLSL